MKMPSKKVVIIQTYEKTEKLSNRNRHCKIIWINPPYSQNIKTNIGKVFLNLVKKNFTKHFKLHQIVNTNILKVSYCCMKNITSMIKQHKSTVLFEPATANCSCNCRNSYSYPLDKKCQQCLKRCLVYKADLHTNCGAKDWDFRSHHSNHTMSFQSRFYENKTKLLRFLWQLKDVNTPFTLKWSTT